MQNEITSPCVVPNEKGLIENPGWARSETMRYCRENIKAPWFRKKEWDYYLFTNDDFGIAFTISDLGYVGLLSASFLDFKTCTEHTETELVWFPRGKKFNLGTKVADTNAEAHTKRLDLVYEKKGRNRHIVCNFRNFDKEKDLVCDFMAYDPDMESMYICTPWKEKPTAFYYNCKRNCLEAEGTVKYGDRSEAMTRETTLGVLDWGRGVWTYDNTWYWGTGSGRVEGLPFGFNLGYGFSDRSAASENVVFYKGHVSKLEEVTFDIPEEDGKRQFLKPWKVTSSDKRFEAVFQPIIDRNAMMDYKVIVTDQHQVFGKLTGYTITDSGEKVSFKDFLCAVEVVRNKY